jgi:hypothetical protein
VSPINWLTNRTFFRIVQEPAAIGRSPRDITPAKSGTYHLERQTNNDRKKVDQLTPSG